ncbi:hypothetical protein TNCV_2611941 [Trichonephila clavipes]|nr:hypothetical protein TNCV_2611941 [Trichonephila clavipes]
MTPELAPPSSNYHTNGKTFALLTDLTCIASPLHGRPLVVLGCELVTRLAKIRYLDHSSTAVTHYFREDMR